jgi:hypothetical protein
MVLPNAYPTSLFIYNTSSNNSPSSDYLYASYASAPSGIFICSLNKSTGVSSNCSISPTAVDFPTTIFISNRIAYITNLGYSGLQAKVTFCNVKADGSLDSGSCNSENDMFSVGTGDAPTDIVIDGNYAYIVEHAISNIHVCTVGAGGHTLSGSCINAGATSIDGPEKIVIHNNQAYITNGNDNSLTICPIKSDHTFNSPCQNYTNSNVFRNANLNVPSGIAINKGKLYIANYANGIAPASLVSCNLFDLTNCNDMKANMPTGGLDFADVFFY